jgi:hydrogenase maturation factor HypE
MTRELYEQVKDEIPKHIGVYVGCINVKRARKQELGSDEQILKNSMIRSLYREAEKVIKSENPNIIESMRRLINYYKKRSKEFEQKYWELMRIGQKNMG